MSLSFGFETLLVTTTTNTESPWSRCLKAAKSGGQPGPLTDPEMEFTEQEAVAHLFPGAMGYIKNPVSHRELNIDDARVAASRILLANDFMYTLAAHVEKKKKERDGLERATD